MFLGAGFFDPNGNGWDIADLAAILGLVLTASAVVVLVRKAVAGTGAWIVRSVREIVREEVVAHTALIQPTSNGGKSLPDVAKRTDRIERLVCELARRSGIDPDA